MGNKLGQPESQTCHLLSFPLADEKDEMFNETFHVLCASQKIGLSRVKFWLIDRP